jgi:thiosulfate dehydrogenase
MPECRARYNGIQILPAMKRLTPLAVMAAIAALYVAAIVLGLRLEGRALPWTEPDGPRVSAWRAPSMRENSSEKLKAIELGSRLFNETPIYGTQYAKARIACGSCHLGGGTAPYSAPVVGSAQAYPQFSARAGRKVSLEDRIDECMTRSENGSPLPSNSPEMKGLKAYIDWLSEPHRGEAKYVGRGLKPMPVLTPDPKHGADIYAAQCAGCHGANGEGARRPFPPLWGPEAFNDGAGMNGIQKMAAFVKVNMPQNRKGILSAQDATDVAAFIHAQSRPAFNHAYDHF